MSEILLVALNASFSHTNIAVRSLELYCQNKNVSFGEWTINQMPFEICRGIIEQNPKMVLFSTYIWNIEMVEKICKNLKSFDENLILGCGGPEVSYSCQEVLKRNAEIDFICVGEGEETVKELVETFEKIKNPAEFKKNLKNVKGLYLQNENFTFTGVRPLISDLGNLKFPYPEITEPDHKIYYYESSRGCPFSCAYCMSSLDKKVRFMPLERVFSDLQFFLDKNVKLVKFVDRTYNLNEERYIAIWDYILRHHNKKTMFHFEIEAEYLSERALDFLQNVPEGVMQFEIGVQSSNQKTLKSVLRSDEILKLAQNIKRLPKTIRCHLDLITGLPYEDLESFGHSFDFVSSLLPDEIQLGFLKVLYGTKMKDFAEENGWVWQKVPPYEIFKTPYLSFKDVCFLKDLEVLLDAYYNSKNFQKSVLYAFRIYGAWAFLSELTLICQEKNVFSSARAVSFWFEVLCDFAKSKNDKVLYELLRFDFVKSGKKGGWPEWYVHNYDKNLHKIALDKNDGIDNSRVNFAYSEYEEFSINPLQEFPENSQKCSILFYYKNKFGQEERQILL